MKNKQMKNRLFFLGFILTGTLLLSCNKEECHECHYDGPGGTEVELGEQCGDALEALEANGYNVDGTNYVVHCHEH